VRLGDIANIEKGKSITKQQIKEGNIPVIAGGKTPAYFHNIANRDGNVITVSASGANSGFVNYFSTPIFASDCNTIISKNEQTISTKLIYEFLQSIQDKIYELQRGQAQPHVYAKDLAEIKLPLPPLSVQEEIVSEIEKLETQEQNAKNEIEKLKAEIGGKIIFGEETTLKSIVEINPSKTEILTNFPANTEVSFLSMADIGNDGKILNIQTKTLNEVKTGFTFFQNGDVIIAKITPCMENGKGAFIENMKNNLGFGSTEFFVLRSNGKILPRLLHYHMQRKDFRELAAKNMTGTSGHKRVSKIFLEDYKLPLPPLEIQQKIVSEIEKLEARISELENELKEIPKMKEKVLKRYL